MKIVAFLQNAWSPVYAGGTWPRESWLKALWRSRSGQRLELIIKRAKGCDFWWDNTTPIVGAHPGSVVAPDAEHIVAVLNEQNPHLVLALGRQSEQALRTLWGGPLLSAPHPAARLLTNDLYWHAGEMLGMGWRGRGELMQGRGKVTLALDNGTSKILRRKRRADI